LKTKQLKTNWRMISMIFLVRIDNHNDNSNLYLLL
jgi:hypothetical protein